MSRLHLSHHGTFVCAIFIEDIAVPVYGFDSHIASKPDQWGFWPAGAVLIAQFDELPFTADVRFGARKMRA
jgi:hypothetical protein